MNLRRLTRTIPAALIAIGLGTSAARAELVFPRPSPNASVSQTIGVTNFALTYSRPGVKGRVIWGGLVPYDSTWRTGAHDPSSLTVSDTILQFLRDTHKPLFRERNAIVCADGSEVSMATATCVKVACGPTKWCRWKFRPASRKTTISPCGGRARWGRATLLRATCS